ncbi:MAG: hypothetical protein Q4D91_09125 [Lautropia sp.]|nr:hypothetical protein [Lautropia sp.]
MTPQTTPATQAQNTQQAAAQRVAAQQTAAEQAVADKAAAAKANAQKAVADKAEAEAKAAADAKAANQAATERTAAVESSAAPAESATTNTITPVADSNNAQTGATGTATTIGATAVAADAGSSTGSLSPWLIGGGVLAAVGIGVAAGGSSGGSASNNASPTPNTSASADKGTTQPDTTVTPDNGSNPPAPGTGGTTPGNTDNTGGQQPAQPDTKPEPADPNKVYTAEGPAATPIVAHNAITNLSEDTLKLSLVNGANAVRIERILSAEGKDADGRVLRFFKNGETDSVTAYEVIEVKDGITWHAAVDRAAALGGKLLTIESSAEAKFLADNFSTRLPGTPYDADSLAANAAWIGLSQAADASAPNAGWKWHGGGDFSAADWQTFGFSLNGQKLPTDGNLTGGAGTEANKANFGVLTQAWQGETTGFADTMISDFGDKDTKLTHFVVEYENYQHPLQFNGKGPVAEAEVIHAEDLGKLSWASLLNSGGTLQIVGVKVDENGQVIKEADGKETVDGTQQTITITEAAATQATAQAADLGRLISVTLDDQALLLS